VMNRSRLMRNVETRHAGRFRESDHRFYYGRPHHTQGDHHPALSYFACISLMQRAKLSMRTRPRSWSQAIWEKIGPHTGITLVP